jgi:hypothetical protein
VHILIDEDSNYLAFICTGKTWQIFRHKLSII